MLSKSVLCIKKKKKKRSYYISDLSDYNFPIKDGKEKLRKSNGGNNNMLHITEDTPADMLSGAMDLSIHLPTGKTIKMCVERSTPMMDLLVQITTNHQLQITNYTLQPIQATSPDAAGDATKRATEKILNYYPNTPIGALDTQIVRVVPKTRTLPVVNNRNYKSSQPFESTFRLKVHLPRNQLYVTRVSRHVQIEEIMKKVCEEKNLDPNNCEVRHPGNLDEILDPKLTLNDYMITEIHLILKGTANLTQTFSSSNDIMNIRKQEEENRKTMHKSGGGGGVFNLIFRRGKTSATETHNNNINETTAVAPPQPQSIPQRPEMMEKPRAPQRKRRPAPKPPSITIETPQANSNSRTNSTISENNNDGSDIVIRKSNETTSSNLTICHSRHSSDSSGYHETSILSGDHFHNNNHTSFPRNLVKTRHSDIVVGNLSKSHSRSTSSLAFPGRKKKTAPPPPPTPLSSSSSMLNLERPSPVVASQNHHRLSTPTTPEPPSITIENILLDPPKTFDEIQVEEIEEEEEDDDQPIYENSSVLIKDYNIESPKDSGNSSDISEKSKLDIEDQEIIAENNDWQLPSPPKMFKDTSSTPKERSCQIEQKIDENNDGQTEPDSSVILTPELFAKLKNIEEKQQQEQEQLKIEESSDISSTTSEDRLILNKLSLENLEKRRSLVYNRELATSLKLNYNNNIEKEEVNPLAKKYNSEADIPIETTPKTDSKTEEKIAKKFNSELSKQTTVSKTIEHGHEIKKTNHQTTTLPNFKISTYDEPKRKIRVFEDDTIRSNSEDRRKSFGSTLDRSKSLKPHQEFPEKVRMFRRSENSAATLQRPVRKSESFSQNNDEWSPTKPVTRSKSHIALKKIDNLNGEMSKSNSLFDVSGLQSLEVMKKIQNALNTPTTSTETLTKIQENENKVQTNATSGPPSINMGTWSERPKVPVSVKEDSDYKLGKGAHKSASKVTLNHFTLPRKTGENVTVNGNNVSQASSNQITEKNGNVVIKIGDNRPKLRPHSVALISSEFETNENHSRVLPVVRSVELKKNLQENTSVVHIEPSKTILRVRSFLQNQNQNKNPVIRGFKNYQDTSEIESKQRHSWSVNVNETPKNPENYSTNQNVPFSKFTLRKTNEKDLVKLPMMSNTLPRPWVKPATLNNNYRTEQKEENHMATLREENNNMPRSQEEKNTKSKFLNSTSLPPPPPPPPEMPKSIPKKITKRQFVPVLDPRDELLKSIRDFGGKKGLKSCRKVA